MQLPVPVGTSTGSSPRWRVASCCRCRFAPWEVGAPAAHRLPRRSQGNSPLASSSGGKHSPPALFKAEAAPARLPGTAPACSPACRSIPRSGLATGRLWAPAARKPSQGRHFRDPCPAPARLQSSLKEVLENMEQTRTVWHMQARACCLAGWHGGCTPALPAIRGPGYSTSQCLTNRSASSCLPLLFAAAGPPAQPRAAHQPAHQVPPGMGWVACGA